jgi:hypothetical protein
VAPELDRAEFELTIDGIRRSLSVHWPDWLEPQPERPKPEPPIELARYREQRRA